MTTNPNPTATDTAPTDTTLPEIVYTLTAEPDHEDPAGHFASGDDQQDAADVAEIREKAEWNVWAWCMVKVTASVTVNGRTFTGCDTLGACSYDGPEDFKAPGGYWEDMKQTARSELMEELLTAGAIYAALKDSK